MMTHSKPTQAFLGCILEDARIENEVRVQRMCWSAARSLDMAGGNGVQSVAEPRERATEARVHQAEGGQSK